MGFFDIFKRKTNKQNKVTEFPPEYLKWNRMWDLWVNGEIESPYNELMEYSSGVNNGGHHCHLDNVNGNQDLAKYVEQLMLILDEPLKTNIKNAFNAYMENPDDVSDENVAVLENCDNVFYQHEDLINRLLQDRANQIIL